MNIKKALINRMVEKEAIGIQKMCIDVCDLKLNRIHKARIENNPMAIRCKDDAELQEWYEYYIALRKEVTVPIKEFVLLDNEELEQAIKMYDKGIILNPVVDFYKAQDFLKGE